MLTTPSSPWHKKPRSAVTDAPPEVADGSVAVRVGTEWEVKEDHRKDVLYVVSSGEQYSLGDSVDIDGVASSYSGLGAIPSWLTITAPEPVVVEVEEP